MTPEQYLADQAILDAIDQQRLAAGYTSLAASELEQLRADLTALLSANAITRALPRERERRAEALITAAYERLSGIVEAVPIAQLYAEKTTADVDFVFVDPAVETEPITELDPVIEGHGAAAWWARQSENAIFVFGGLGALSLADAALKLAAWSQGAFSASRALIVTSTSAAAATGRLSAYKANSDKVGGYQQISILDGRTSEVCRDYAGCTWDLDFEPTGRKKRPFNGGCPRHMNCRSIICALVNKSAAASPDLDDSPSVDHATAPFSDWLDTLSKETADEVFGVGRAAQFRKGTITLKQLLDVTRNPTTLARLREKYAREN